MLDILRYKIFITIQSVPAVYTYLMMHPRAAEIFGELYACFWIIVEFCVVVVALRYALDWLVRRDAYGETRSKHYEINSVLLLGSQQTISAKEAYSEPEKVHIRSIQQCMLTAKAAVDAEKRVIEDRQRKRDAEAQAKYEADKEQRKREKDLKKAASEPAAEE